jgi:O-antigen/teichoic acid export membrane protein
MMMYYKQYYIPYLKDVPICWSKELFLTIMKYALIVFLTAEIGTILSQIDMQLIIYMLGTTQAGYYTNYLSIIGIPFIIIGPIFSFLLPVISELHGKNDIGKIRMLKGIFNKNFFNLGGMINIFFFVFAGNLAYVLF